MASDGLRVLLTSFPDAFRCFEEDGEANVVLGHDTVDHFMETVGSFNRQLIELHQMLLDCPESKETGNNTDMICKVCCWSMKAIYLNTIIFRHFVCMVSSVAFCASDPITAKRTPNNNHWSSDCKYCNVTEH